MTTEPTGDIFARLAWIMDQVPIIHKTNMPNVTYKAFAIDSLYTNLRGLFGKAGVYIMPRLQTVEYVPGSVEKKGRGGDTYLQTWTDVHLVMRYVFRAPDGSKDWMEVPGESRDYGDKGTFQATQQAIKYGFVQAFMIATGEPDADDNNPTAEESQPAASQPPDFNQEAWTAIYHMSHDKDDDASAMWATALDKAGVKSVSTAEDRDAVVTAAGSLVPKGEEPFT